ncbi:MAG: hypothetical protein GF329_07385 [Candidatus Lokiarchaeota archaeon]|nr:hypothetical protein [Candidatus Lokiarchaeota archaeon]
MASKKSSNKILRILFEFRSEYIGCSKYITGNALRYALSMPISTSIGIFTDYHQVWVPDSYQNFFKIRKKKSFLKPYFYFIWDKYTQKRVRKCFYTPNSVTFDLTNPPEDIIDQIQNLSLIQFGGGRNLGYGTTELIHWVWIDPNFFEYPEDATHITLLSPILYIPSFVHKYACRKEYEIFWNHGKKNKLHIIPPGQFFRIKSGKDIKKISQKGLLKKALLGQFGYGEFFLANWPKGGKGN